MNEVSFIWATVAVFLLSGLIFTRAKIFLLLLIIWLIRTICLKKLTVVMQALLISVCFFIHFSHKANSINTYNQSRSDIEIDLRVYPDEIKPMEDGVSIRAYTNNVNRKGLQVFIPVKTVDDLKKISKTQKVVEFKIKGNIEPLERPTNINQFDFRRIMYGKAVYFKVSKASLIEYNILTKNSLIAKIHSWRKKLLERCIKLEEPLQSYCMGIILGEQTDYLKENSTKLRNMGIIHLFCISGLHVFYFIKLIEIVFTRFKIKRETMEITQIGVLPLYFILGGGSTSLFRAVVLVLVQLITKKIAIKISTLDSWCLVLLVNLWLNPFVLLQMGGQLSYLLSFVLIMQQMENSWTTGIKLFLVELPIILFSTYKIHLLTMVFNLIIVPIFSSVIVPIVIVAFALPQLMALLNPIIMMFEVTLKYLDKLPGLIQVGKPSRLITLFMVILALKIISTKQSKFKKRALTFYSLIWLGLWSWFKLNPYGEITFFDVGQGDSILIREPFNRTVTLIDTGGKMQFGKKPVAMKHTIAKNSSINYLQSIGVSKLNNLCLTHQDVDHIGEASEILNNFKVKNLVFPVGVDTTQNYQRKILPFIRRNTKVIACLAGTKIDHLPMEIKYPFQAGKGENGDSLVLAGNVGGKNLLLTGDLDLAGERKLLESGVLNQRVDIFKLGHHGSKTANSEEILKVIMPKLAIVSAGRHNRYGHPNLEVINRLNSMGIPYASTQDEGMISYRYFLNGMGRWKTGIDEKESIIQ